MNTRRLLVFLTVIVVLTSVGCRRSRSGATTLATPSAVALTVLGAGSLFFDPLAGPGTLITEILLRNDTDPAQGDAGDLEVDVQCPDGCQPSQDKVFLEPGQEATIQVFTTAVAIAAVLTIDVIARYVLGGPEALFPVEITNLALQNPAFAVLAALSTPLFAVLWFASAVIAPVGVLTNNSNPSVPQRIPQLAQDVRLFGAVAAFVTLVTLQAWFGANVDVGGESFPPGQGPNGFTVTAAPTAPLAAGDYVTFWMSVSADIPLESQAELFQYAFVVDSDADMANNYTPSPAFPDDFFAGTDRWYVLDYAPGSGWTLQCRVVGANNSITTVASGARAILNGDSIVLVVPQSEFVVSRPPFRATTFAHLGDFGQNPPFTWSGDPTPTVAEGLRSWQ